MPTACNRVPARPAEMQLRAQSSPLAASVGNRGRGQVIWRVADCTDEFGAATFNGTKDVSCLLYFVTPPLRV